MATDSILTIQAAVAGSGIPVRTAGPVRVVRPIAKSKTPSQHSFENAMDYYPTSSDEATRAKAGERVASLEALYQYLTTKRRTGELPIEVVCYYRRGGCTTEHLDHLHVDGDPHVDRVVTDGTAQPVDSTGPGAGFGRGSGRSEIDPDSLFTSKIDLSSPLDFLGLLASGELWQRVGFVIGGFIAIAAGIYFIAKEFGLPSVTTVAKTAAGAKLPG